MFRLSQRELTMKSEQAQRIIAKFGGPRRLAIAIGCQPPAVYRWTYPRDRGGTDGYLPNAVKDRVKAAADLLGVEITAEDWAS
jgi:hypothetical protein